MPCRPHLRERRAVADVGEHVSLVQTEHARGILLTALEHDRLKAFEAGRIHLVSADDDRIVGNRRRDASQRLDAGRELYFDDAIAVGRSQPCEAARGRIRLPRDRRRRRPSRRPKSRRCRRAGPALAM